jgi:hypothetical protein
MTTTPNVPEDREAALVTALEALDAYLASADALQDRLKAGWMNLARAKYAAAPHAHAAALLSAGGAASSLPLGTEATAVVAAVADGGGASIKDAAAAAAAGAYPSWELRQRSSSGSGSSSEDGDGGDGDRTGNGASRQDRLLRLIGGALPPPDLRRAQADFGAALSAAVTAANALQALRGAAYKWRAVAAPTSRV